tara:strand:+ start:1077 stop:1838 length:762 start_codon:yes stop_codon:yes gene_type:complete
MKVLRRDILHIISSHIQAMLLKSKLESIENHMKGNCKTRESTFNISFKPYLDDCRIPYIPCVSCKKEIIIFLRKILEETKCEIEIVISMFLLFKRILEKNKQFIELEIDNLKPLLFVSFYISKKVVDNDSMNYSKYIYLWEKLSPEHELLSFTTFAGLEMNFLKKIQWNVNISENTFYLFQYELYKYIKYQTNYISVKHPQLFTWYPFPCLLNNLQNVNTTTSVNISSSKKRTYTEMNNDNKSEFSVDHFLQC